MPEKKNWMGDPSWDRDSFPLSYDDDPDNPIGCHIDDGLDEDE